MTGQLRVSERQLQVDLTSRTRNGAPRVKSARLLGGLWASAPSNILASTKRHVALKAVA